MVYESDPRHPVIQLGCERLGAMVRRRRHQVGWTQHGLSERSGVSQSVISRLENGKLRGLSLGHLAAMIGVLNGLDPREPLPRGAAAWALPPALLERID